MLFRSGDTFIHARLRRPLRLRPFEQLHSLVPARDLASGGPATVAEAPARPDGVKRVEFYPISSTSENYFYVYWRSIGDLQRTDYLPSSVPAYGLIEGALVDLFRYKMSQSAKTNAELAAFWRNEMRTQETKWDKYLVEMIGADRGEDDATFILRTTSDLHDIGDLMTARDHIYSNWSWNS